MTEPHAVTGWQVRRTKEVVRWYLERHHGTPHDPGTAATFCDPGRIGHFAVDREALAAGDADALFRVLVATTLFQKRSDQQMFRLLRGISVEDASEITCASRLLSLARDCGCDHVHTTEDIRVHCDLTKDPATGRGTCAARPGVACAPKRHTVLLKRYGHFGKVPTSVALAVREAGAADLADLHRLATAEGDPEAAAATIEGTLRRAWRVSDKIAAMFLSMVSNPDLSPDLSPWAGGLDWCRWVVVDSNVDLFLAAIGYEGAGTYRSRAGFIHTLARRIPLDELKPGLRPFNPRLVQQAMFVFMGRLNRRVSEVDCAGEGRCGECPSVTRSLCPLAS